MLSDGLKHIMTEAYNDGAHVDLEAVAYRKIDKLKVQFEEQGSDWKWRRFCVDGMIVGIEEGGWVEVEMVENTKPVLEIQLAQ